MVSFWATEISETKAAIVKIPKGCVLNLCNVTSASYTPNEKSNVMSVGVETTLMDHSPWKGVIAHVGSGVNTYQVKIDLVFGLTSQVKFYVAKGCGKVNLSGYFQPGPSVVVDEAEEEEGNESKESSLLQQQQTLIKTKKRPREESTKEKTITWDQTISCSDNSEEDNEEEIEVKRNKPASTTTSTPLKNAAIKNNTPKKAAPTLPTRTPTNTPIGTKTLPPTPVTSKQTSTTILQTNTYGNGHLNSDKKKKKKKRRKSKGTAIGINEKK